MDDHRIIELFFARDERALQEFSAKYGALCRRITRTILGNDLDAEECENDTYLSAWNSIPPNEPRGYLYAFLARITRHISLNRCRDQSRLKRSALICELSEEMEQCLPDPDDAVRRADDTQLRAALNGFLCSLDEEKRNIFIRRYWYMDSIADISKRFALSESKVKTTLFRCRERLREQLRKEGYTL